MSASPSAVLRLRMRHGGPGRPPDPSSAPTRLERAELHPDGLPPSAVLVVRRLTAVLPPFETAPRSSRGDGPRWDHRLRQELTDLARRAARPDRGRLPDDAEAVLFGDRAELVACLVTDLLRGVADRCWWWEGPLLGTGTTDVAAVLARDVALLPGALDQLQTWDLADAAVRRLPLGQATALLAGIRRTFALPSAAPGSRAATAPGNVLSHGRATDREAGTAEPPSARGAADPAVDGRGNGTPDVAAWERWLGSSAVPSSLDGERALLLATALLLVRAPGAARSAVVSAALERDASRRDVALGPDPARRTPDAGPAPEGFPESGAGSATPAGPNDSSVAPGVGAVHVDRPDAGPAGGIGAPGPRGAGDAPGAGASGDAASTPPSGSRTPADAAAGSTRSGSSGFPGPVPVPVTEQEPSPGDGSVSGLPEAVRTGLAGVFYLIDLVPRLDRWTADGVPPGAGEAWHAGHLTGWALLEALGRGLLAAHPSTVAGEADHDGLWRLLARLDGRLTGVPTVALDPAVVTRVGQRLADELGTDVTRAIDALRVPGRVDHSRTHVDVVMDLESISVPVRMAGLDRDPGWVPALSHVIAFHYARGGP